MAELPTKISALSRTLVPLPGGFKVLCTVLTVLQITAQQIHRLGVPQLSRLPVQRHGGKLILCYAAPRGQQVGVVVHGPVQSGFGCLTVFQTGQSQIRRPAPAMLPTATEPVARHQVTRVGCDLEPAPGQHRVTFDALPVEQNLPQQRLAIDDALLGCQQDRLSRPRRIFSQHGAELFAIEQFLAA